MPLQSHRREFVAAVEKRVAQAHGESGGKQGQTVDVVIYIDDRYVRVEVRSEGGHDYYFRPFDLDLQKRLLELRRAKGIPTWWALRVVTGGGVTWRMYHVDRVLRSRKWAHRAGGRPYLSARGGSTFEEWTIKVLKPMAMRELVVELVAK